MTERDLHDAAIVLRAVMDVPAERRMDAVATALRVAIDHGWLTSDSGRSALALDSGSAEGVG